MKQPWKLIFRGQSSSSQWTGCTCVSPSFLPRRVSPAPASWTQSRPHVSMATCRLLTVCCDKAELPSVSVSLQRVKRYSCSRFLIHSHQILNPSPPSPPHPATLLLFLLCIILFSFISSLLFFYPTLFLPSFLPSVCQYFLSSSSLYTFCLVFTFSPTFFLPPLF